MNQDAELIDCFYKNIKDLPKLIDKYNLNYRSRIDGKNLLHFLAETDKKCKWIDYFEKKFTKNELDYMVNERDDFGNNVFHFVANNCFNKKMLKFLLKLAKNMNKTNVKNFEGCRPTRNAEYWSEKWAEILGSYLCDHDKNSENILKKTISKNRKILRKYYNLFRRLSLNLFHNLLLLRFLS